MKYVNNWRNDLSVGDYIIANLYGSNLLLGRVVKHNRWGNCVMDIERMIQVFKSKPNDNEYSDRLTTPRHKSHNVTDYEEIYILTDHEYTMQVLIESI